MNPHEGHTGMIIGIVVVAVLAFLMLRGGGASGGSTQSVGGASANDVALANAQSSEGASIFNTLAQYELGVQQTAASTEQNTTSAGVTELEAQLGFNYGESQLSAEEGAAAQQIAGAEYIANQERSLGVAQAKAGQPSALAQVGSFLSGPMNQLAGLL